MSTDRAHLPPHGEIMVVEDDTSTLKCMSAILTKAGYQVRPAGNGKLALRSVRPKLPDLILLDVRMPGMDGVEVCRRLKADPGTRDVPVIFISALGETDLKVKALEAGGIDYVTKPVQPSEVLARISAHLNMHRMQRRLAVQSEELLAEIEERKRVEQERLHLEVHLRQAQKLESISTLAGGVAHEINSPIMGIMNYAQLIKDELEGKDETLEEFAGEIIHETKRVATLIKNLLQFACHEQQSYRPARLCDIVEGTLSLIRAAMRHDQITIEVDVPEDLPRIKCRSQQIQQVIMNLLTNARDALNDKYPGYHEDKVIRISTRELGTAGSPGGPMLATATCHGGLSRRSEAKTKATRRRKPGEVGASAADSRSHWIRITVEDHGAGIPEEIRERLFDPFYTTKDRTKDTGLGLSVSLGIVRNHHGELSFECEPDQYTHFHLDLPVDNGWELGSIEHSDESAEDSEQ